MSLTNINIAYPETSERDLKIAVGACRLKIKPGSTDAWVAGSYDDPSARLPCKILQEGSTVKITQEVNPADIFGFFTAVPIFDLALGTSKPYALTIEAGASETKLDLGGLPLTHLTIHQGASKYTITFSAPNPQEMSTFAVGAGAGSVELNNLANANFAELQVDGGAAAYKLDFSGALRRSANVRVATGVSSVELNIPGSTAAKIVPESFMGGLDVGDGFTKQEGGFCTPAALTNHAPLLSIKTNVAFGSLRLRLT